MASVHRNPASPYWHGAYRDAEGARRKFSTKLTDRSRALAMVRELEKVAKKARAGLLVESAAREAISELVEQATGEPLAFETVESWAKTWLAGKKAVRAENTGVRYTTVMRDFLAFLGPRARLNIALLRTADVEAFRAAEVDMGKQGKSVNITVKIVGSMVAAAMRRGLVKTNVASLESLPENPTEKPTFAPAQLSAVARVAATKEKGEWRTMLLLGYYTGGRLSDLAKLKRGSLDLDKGTVKFLPRKTKRFNRPVFAPLHRALLEHLRGLDLPSDPEAPILPALSRKAAAGENGLSKTFGRIVNEAGIAAPTLRAAAGAKGRTMKGLGFHGLRHSFISGLMNAGVTAEMRKRLAGHVVTGVHDAYSHAEVETLRRELNKLPRIEL